MKAGRIKVSGYLALLTFITGWVLGNLTFPAVSLAMTTDHAFRLTYEDGNTHIVYYHPEADEAKPLNISNPKPQEHEHKFLIPDYENDLIISYTQDLDTDTQRAPPLSPVSEAFTFIPADLEYYYRFYQNIPKKNTVSLSLKTVILLN